MHPVPDLPDLVRDSDRSEEFPLTGYHIAAAGALARELGGNI